MTAVCCVAGAGQVPGKPAAPVRKSYVDATNGVSFSYPAGWTLNGDDDAATAKLRFALSSEANAVVTLEGNFADAGPYKGTEFEAGAFAYAVSAEESEAQCDAALEESSDGRQHATAVVWNGMRARRLDATYTVAGTDDVHRALAVFARGRCYRFETVIVSHRAEDAERPLSAARWKALRAQFEGVLESVRVRSGPAGRAH